MPVPLTLLVEKYLISAQNRFWKKAKHKITSVIWPSRFAHLFSASTNKASRTTAKEEINWRKGLFTLLFSSVSFYC
jgi:hypothetical protein